MPSRLKVIKTRKFEHDFDQVKRYFAEICPDPSTFYGDQPQFDPWIYSIDNCLMDLCSIWDGVIHHLRLALVEAGSASLEEIQEPKWRSNSNVLAMLREHGGNDELTDYIQDKYESIGIQLLQFVRNELVHRAMKKRIHLHVMNSIDFILWKAEDKQVLFFRDMPAFFDELQAVSAFVNEQLPLEKEWS
jgi:hypothetical protein